MGSPEVPQHMRPTMIPTIILRDVSLGETFVEKTSSGPPCGAGGETSLVFRPASLDWPVTRAPFSDLPPSPSGGVDAPPPPRAQTNFPRRHSNGVSTPATCVSYPSALKTDGSFRYGTTVGQPPPPPPQSPYPTSCCVLLVRASLPACHGRRPGVGKCGSHWRGSGPHCR